MSRGARFWLALVLLNLTLAAAAALVAPGEDVVSHTTDRAGYEFVGQHPFAASCPHSIYCYRVLVPVALEQLPLPPVVRWRGLAVLAHALTGVVLATVALRGARRTELPVTGRQNKATAVIASVLFQTSFGATFSLFDPFTPDPVVYLCAALLTLCWLTDRPWLALAVALSGLWAKETVALIAFGIGPAALFARPTVGQRRLAWLGVALGPAVVVVTFHLAANALLGWSEAASGSADISNGAWLGRWLADTTLTPATRAFYLFIPFAFAWFYALVGIRSASSRLRVIALATVIVLPVLVYVQTPERALATASCAVVPLASLFLGRIPLPLGLLAAATNGLLTARVGLATNVLLPVPYWLVLAAVVGAATVLWTFSASRRSSPPEFGSSPLTSSR